MPHNPDRNYAIHWLLQQRAIAAAAAAAVGGAGGGTGGGTDPPADATGEVTGDVRGALLGPLSVVGVHGDEIAPPALTGDEDDYAPEDPIPLIWRLDLDGNTITGFAAPAQLGEVHLIVALSAGTLAHEDAGSAAANRLLVPGAADLAMDADDLALAIYDGTSQRWRVGPMRAPATVTYTWNEVPTGTIDGVNAAFTLAAVPTSVMLFKNGLLQQVGTGNDFTLAGAVITFEAGNLPQVGDVVLASYAT